VLPSCDCRVQLGGYAEVPLPEIAPGDLDVAIVGQLPAADLSLGDKLEPSSLQMVRLQAPLRRRALVEEALENPPWHPDDGIVLADTDAEFDRVQRYIPSRVFGEHEKHCNLLPGTVACSCIVLKDVMTTQGERIPGGFILITGLDGVRYAVRPQSVGIIHDADECRDETIVQLHGGHVVRVPCTLDEVLVWFL
jgi:hypothetical protein